MRSFITTPQVGALLAAAFQLTSASPACDTRPRLGAVASESSVCSKIGISVLEKGGNAADATVATVFCVGVIGMYHSGVAGGGFMTVRSSSGEYNAIDFRETAPAAATQNMYVNNSDASLYGGLASGVPGEQRGLQKLHELHGSMPWEELVMPAVDVARNGFEVTQDLVNKMEGYDFLYKDPNWAIDFAPNGTLVQLGDIMTRKRYADTLETIAHEGADVFYHGEMAKAMIKEVQRTGGILTMEDLKNYSVVLREPQQVTYRGHLVTSGSAPSSGAVALSILNIIGGYEGFGDESQINLTTHRLDEAMKFAYGQRAELGDPSFVDGLAEYQAGMLKPETGAEIRAKIQDNTTHQAAYYDPSGYEILDTPGTSQVSIADKSGMAVSLTTTVNLLFGSQVLVPETGVIMNNEMNDFSIPETTNAFGYPPSPANFVRPGKRPLSSISCSILEYPESEGGGLYFVTGSAGGSRIITATVNSIHNVIDRGDNTLEALARRRMHDQLSPAYAEFEYGFPEGIVDYMASIGNNVTWALPGNSTAQAVRLLPNGTFEAAGEPRQHASGGFAV